MRGFFDTIDHGWLVKFVEHWIANRRVGRLIQKWLNAGVLEDGKRMWVEDGMPEGGSASPLMTNNYLHHLFDLWVQAWRHKQARGDLVVVRFADDIVLGFQNKSDAERFGRFRLELHPERTRLMQLGPFVGAHWKKLGQGEPDPLGGR